MPSDAPSQLAAQRTPPSAVDGVAAALRFEIMGKPSGSHLGSEAELLQRFRVSAPTLRQAARLLERKQLLSVERGPKGGYYGRRPTTHATARAAALYLQIAGTTRRQVFQASFPLMTRAGALAARSTDAASSEAFHRAYEALRSLPPNTDGQTALALDRALVAAMLDLAGNPALKLFLKVVYRLGRLNDTRQRIFESEAHHARGLVEHTLDLAEAILERDSRLAVLMVQRWQAFVSDWLEEFEAAEPLDLQAERPHDRSSLTAVQQAAESLRAEILERPPGAFLGSEEELAHRLSVSRHTIRQAATLLQHDQVLETRRGLGGGYVGRRPDIDAVVDAAALYLEINNGGLPDLIVASQCLAVEACRLAALSTDEPRRQALRRAVHAFAHEPAPAGGDPTIHVLWVEQRFMETVLQMADNPPIELFVKSMYRYGATLRQPVHGRPDRADEWRISRARLARAILDGDAEAAAIIAHRPGDRMLAWLAGQTAP